MSDASDAVKDLNQELQTTEARLDSITAKAKSFAGFIRGGRVSGGDGNQVANQSSSTTGAAGGGNGGSFGGMDVGGLPDFKDPNARTARSRMLGIAGGLIQTGAGLASFLPSSQEAMNVDTLANRLRFYGNSAAQQNIGGAFTMQRALAALGTPINALDPAAAANAGAGMGLLPGLSNYNATAQFGGVLGGAALASNLTPGLGLQGGMAAMAGLNSARNVNMLRMIGVDVRNQQGQMNDLPDVIGQIFKLLEQSAGTGNVTAASIAVSAMSGNALDSILNQYFGNDSALRQTVLSGLLQMANTGGASLRTSGTKSSAMGTGAMSSPVASLAGRNAAEQNMLQQWSSATNTGFIAANAGLSKMYNGIGNAASGTGVLSRSLQGLQAGIVGMETFGGARNGAGTILTEGALNTIGGLTGSPIGTQLGLLGFGAVTAGVLGNTANGGTGINPNVSPNLGGNMNAYGTTSTAPVYTGNITINVTAPTGSDPWAFANQVTQAMVSTARS